MKQSPQIREALIADAPAISLLFGQLGHPVAAPALKERLRVFSAPGRGCLVAVVEGRIVGVCTLNVMIALHRPKTVGRISAMVVDEAHRGQGIGRALVLAAETRLRDWGCATLEVTSNLRRTDAHAFYEHLGYDRTSARFAKVL